MRRLTTIALAALALPALALPALALGVAAPAFAAAPVEVTVGPDLAKKTKSYGARDIELVRKWLDESATRALSRPGAAAVVRADLVLADAVPNRPTFNQMGRNNQLSFTSVGVGGAKITGTVTTADGVVHPVSYAFYESNIQNEIGATTWRDAERAFEMMSSKLAHGNVPQQAHPMSPSSTGNFGERYPGERFE